jgi:hypothetical protein
VSFLQVMLRASLSRIPRTLASQSQIAPRTLTSTSYAMSIEASMRAKLTKQLEPIKLNIRNDSAKHAHHAAMVAQGGGSGETRECHWLTGLIRLEGPAGKADPEANPSRPRFLR